MAGARHATALRVHPKASTGLSHVQADAPKDITIHHAWEWMYAPAPFFQLIFYCRNEMKDTRLALQCLAAAEPAYQEKYMSTVIFDANTPRERDRLLTEMREFATTPEQVALVNNTLSQLAFGPDHAKLAFREVSNWLDSANLPGEELVGATKDMQNKVRVGETGQWLDWLSSAEMPDDLAKERAFQLAVEWTGKDYLAAGKWLNTAPDSPEKSAVASAFAAKVHPYDPAVAMQWIQTLPQGPTGRGHCITSIRACRRTRIPFTPGRPSMRSLASMVFRNAHSTNVPWEGAISFSAGSFSLSIGPDGGFQVPGFQVEVAA
jgi:hypothetical protein